jgi:hypothetical protein
MPVETFEGAGFSSGAALSMLHAVLSRNADLQ